MTDSAKPSVRPCERISASTTDSMVSSSAPNTASPITARALASTPESTRPAVSSSAALAVMRTLRPSMPLARKAMVASPVASRRPISGASSSARPDSEWPQVRSVRLRITLRSPARACRSGSTHSLTILFISQGTPGTA